MSRNKEWRYSHKQMMNIPTHCSSCMNDCKGDFDNNCAFYKQSVPIQEYNDAIREQNRNLHKLCKKHKLKYQIMKDMLNEKMPMSYKYHVVLMSELYEKEEYLEYVNEEVEGD